MKSVVIDNGAGTIKAGFAGDNQPKICMPNCAAKLKGQLRTLVGDETVGTVRDSSQLTFLRPFDRGHLLKWGTELEIWHRLFDQGHLSISPSEHSLLLTEAPFSPLVLQETTNEVVFEELGFQGLYRSPSSALSMYYERAAEKGGHGQQGSGGPVGRGALAGHEASYVVAEGSTLSGHPGASAHVGRPQPDAMIVVESGFSFTHVVPFVSGRALQGGVVRLNVGGKLLTNHLKKVVSYRQWNMMDEFQLMNEVKESLCYVSQDFKADLNSTSPDKKRSRPPGDHGLLREFVLPDFKTVNKGFAREVDDEARRRRLQGGGEEEDHQVLTMERERFSVPEVLFHPSDIGLKQAGVAESVAAAIHKCDPTVQPGLWGNVLLVGGNTLFPGYQMRMATELRKLAPEWCDVNVSTPKDPICHAWKGGSLFASSREFKDFVVTKAEYEEHGHRICHSKFSGW